MKIRVRLVALENLRQPPFDSEGDGVLDLPEGASLADVLARLPLQGLGNVMTLLNDTPVPTDQRASTTLSDNDGIIIFPPLEGG